MKSSNADEIEPIDHWSSRSICNAVGERLQQALRPDQMETSSRLQHLIDELRRRDEAEAVNSN